MIISTQLIEREFMCLLLRQPYSQSMIGSQYDKTTWVWSWRLLEEVYSRGMYLPAPYMVMSEAVLAEKIRNTLKLILAQQSTIDAGIQANHFFGPLDHTQVFQAVADC